MKLSKMKILAVAHGLWRGGAQESFLDMLRLLKSKSLDISVVMCDQADFSFVSDIKKLKVATFLAPYRIAATYTDIAIEKFSKLVESSDIIWISDIEYPVALKVKRIRKDHSVIAHIHSYALICPLRTAAYGLLEICMKRCSVQQFIRCKQLLHKHYTESDLSSKPKIMFRQLLDCVKGPIDFMSWSITRSKMNVIDNIDAFVAVSNFVKDLNLTHLPYLSSVPIEVVPNPILIPKLRKNKELLKDNSTILYASGPDLTKGVHIALYTVRELLFEGRKDIMLIMLGSRGNTWIEKTVRKLRIQENVKLLPKLKREEVYILMANCKLVLMPSISPEAFGRVPAEANLLGTPAIVSNRGALPEIIVNGVTGFVTEPSIEAFTRAVNDALSTEWDRQQIISTAEARFNPQRIAEVFLHLFKKFA